MMTMIAAMAMNGLLMNLLYAVLILAVVGCLLYCIDVFIYPLPGPLKLVIAIIVLIIVVIKVLGAGGGGF